MSKVKYKTEYERNECVCDGKLLKSLTCRKKHRKQKKVAHQDKVNVFGFKVLSANSAAILLRTFVIFCTYILHIFCCFNSELVHDFFFAMLFAAFEDSFMVGNFVGAFLTVCFWFEFTTTGKWTSGGVRCVCKLVGILLNLFAALRFTFCEGRMERLKWSTHKCKSANSNTPLPHLSQRDN